MASMENYKQILRGEYEQITQNLRNENTEQLKILNE